MKKKKTLEDYGWTVVLHPESGCLHVIPRNDLDPHTAISCWCKPTWNGDAYIHNSFDHRERHEPRASNNLH